MASRSRNFGLASLLIICSAVALSVSCSSPDKKKVAAYVADGGAAGEAGSAGTSTVVPSEAGSAGASTVSGEAGAGGSSAGAAGVSVQAGAGGVGGAEVTPTAGAGGALSQGGSAGAVQATACVPSGTVTGASFGQVGNPVACPGTSIQTFFNGDAPADFTCCGTLESVAGAFAISGFTNMDGGGQLKITVPADAPLGQQNLNVNCPGSEALSASLNIVNPAVVTGIDASVRAGNTLTITGTDFGAVSSIALKDGEVTRDCGITSKTATTLTCIPQYTGLYWAELSQGSCYPAANMALKVSVLPPT